jgi:hypothetical protein
LDHNSQLLNLEISSFQLKDGTGVFAITSVPKCKTFWYAISAYQNIFHLGTEVVPCQSEKTNLELGYQGPQLLMDISTLYRLYSAWALHNKQDGDNGRIVNNRESPLGPSNGMCQFLQSLLQTEL